MQFKQTLVRLLFLMIPFTAVSQTSYLQQDARENIILERLEIKRHKDSILNFSKIRPFTRKHVAAALLRSTGDASSAGMSKVDLYNQYRALSNSIEYVPDSMKALFRSKRTFLKHFYTSPSNLYEVNVPDFFLAVNPVFQYTVGKEKDNDQHLFLNTRGISLRGRIANKIGFQAYVTDNQERDPLYVQQWEAERQAVPGQGFYKEFKLTGYDYFDARGQVTFNVTRYIDVAFGYDKNFIGNGHRSLFLSDFSNSALFLKLNTRIWKFNYQNLFMELQAAERQGADILIPKKYAAMHHLDLAVTKWLNIGLFEGVVFSRPDKFEFGYLNPVIFYRSIEQQNGSFDNAVAGIDAKANIARKVQLYSQFLLDEFNLSEMRKGSGWWGNKWGLQLGAKYIDAFNIRNLDLQVETNRVRPFTYSHRDSVANYTHYNQPLAHPLGANFQEWIGIARFQPIERLFIQAKGIFYTQGRDTGSVSFGSNIFYPNIPPFRRSDFGYNLGAGISTKTAYASLLFSYEIKPNFFIEANPVWRKVGATPYTQEQNTFVINAGIRWNMHRREFDF
jgi:hypothetical protein